MQPVQPTREPVVHASHWCRWFEGLHSAGRHAPPVHGDVYERLTRAREFIDLHQGDPIDLDLIAKQAHFSRFHFLRMFREAFGDTPHRYLTRARLARARHLLSATDRSVTDVCFEVGFQSVGSFSTLFQKHLGHSPNRYRARVFPVPGLPVAPIPACFLRMFGGRAA